MWPWEHLAVGYVLYSISLRLAGRRSPGGLEALVVTLAAVLPDLVDKPLSWTFGLTETGYSVAHSVFVAPVLVALVLLAARGVDRPRLASAFVVGYLSHLLGDVVYPFVRGGALAVHAILWPVVVLDAPRPTSILAGFDRYFSRFLYEMTAGDLSAVFLFELGLATCVGLLWAFDGFPGVAGLYRVATGHDRD